MGLQVKNLNPSVTKTMTFGILETKHVGPVPGTGTFRDLLVQAPLDTRLTQRHSQHS